MASVDFQTMQSKVASLYSNATWEYRVYHQMSREQVMAIYFKSLEDCSFEKLKKKKKIEKENSKVKQMTIFDWLKEKING